MLERVSGAELEDVVPFSVPFFLSGKLQILDRVSVSSLANLGRGEMGQQSPSSINLQGPIGKQQASIIMRPASIIEHQS